MYLKTLELQGFKSFPDKTVIEFDKGMTAIVGANGSGKSNISDAVRWVLGEMSAKSLRGSKMEDIIFNGSGKRKPASFAEVVMTIDNSDFLMKIDFDEVSVGRRLYRSGESEYYLNKKQVRLKDIVDLFLNTGIGREGYSVISQGKIAEIISLKGNERRELFEEAAGISRFRYRKHEAGLKLQSVNDNAVRIGDILAEVQGRLPRLEQQSAKAKAYLAIVEEKKTLELGIWAQRMDKIIRFRKEGQEKYESEDKALKALSDEIDEQDRKIDALYIETQEKNMKSEILRGEVSELASSDSDLSSVLSVLENEIHHIELRRDEILSQGEKDDTREKALMEEKEKLNEAFSVIQTELSEIEEKFSENRGAQNALAAEYTALVEREDALLTEKEAISDQKESLNMELKEGEGFGRAGEEQKKELQKRLSEGGGKDETLRIRLEEKRKLADEALNAKAEAEKENGTLNLTLYHLGEEIEETGDALQKHRLEKMEAEQRRDTLLRMERLLEGFSESVKEIMNAAGSELSGICGPVSKLISTDEKYVLAVETALGGGVQNIVVEEEKDAKDAIAFLKKNRLGRATFLPLTTLRAGLYDTSDIHESGFLGRASDLCRSEEKYRVAIEFLLGKTLICEDIESASRLAKSEKYGVRIVTLDGQIIHAGGSFTGGQALNLTGVLSRSGDLTQLKDTIAEKEKKIAVLRGELDAKEEKRSQLREQLKVNEEKLSQLRMKEGVAQNELTLEAERMNAAKSDVLRMEQEILEIDRRIGERQVRADEIRGLLSAFDLRDRKITDELDALSLQKEEKEKKREEYIIAQGEILALRGQAQLRLEQEAAKLNDNAEAFRQLEEGGKNKEELLASLEKSKEDALLKIEDSKKQRETLKEQITAKQEEIRQLLDRVNAAGEESAKVRSAQKEKQAEKERRMEAFSRLAGRLASAEKERESIIRSLAEEYEIAPEHMEFEKARETDTESLGGEARLQALRGELRRIGPVNLDSVQELEEAQERFRFLDSQYSDITKSREELEKLIADLETTMRDMFTETFEQIRYTFRQIFVELFGGGNADIELTNKEDLLNCGVEIRVQPPGKVIKNLSLLSGGEQAFVAIALYMSLLRINPSPFCIFDEIESALDEANVRRFAQYIKKHNDKTQFIVITHRRGTMEEADTLYGITMQEKGVSDFIRLDAAESGKYASDGK
ncbi:MAG: chromosome segregation protein SMC [Ruminococcaceae bacterium]|nr:chromosome segregation protein SMC [Oscillospiraceae bacterium]